MDGEVLCRLRAALKAGLLGSGLCVCHPCIEISTGAVIDPKLDAHLHIAVVRAGLTAPLIRFAERRLSSLVAHVVTSTMRMQSSIVDICSQPTCFPVCRFGP